ncbi:MAG: putative Ig domain-containing protein, partial [Terriglobales bacterium]
MTSGQLPPGVSLSPTGTLSGTPTAGGSFAVGVTAADSASPADTANASLTLVSSVSSGRALDQYGGVSAVSLTNTSGYFRTQKVGSRWVLVDPDGHPYFLLGVFGVDYQLTNTAAGAAAVMAKYSNNEYTWGLQTVRRLRSWGFNAAGEYSSAYVTPVNTYGSYETSEPMPWIDLRRPEYYSLTDSGNLAPGLVKDVWYGVDSEYSGYRAPLPDVYDANFAAYANGDLKAYTSSGEKTSPWLIGTAVGDVDDLWGLQTGPDVTTTPPGYASANLAWAVLCTNYEQAANASLKQVYADTKVYSKYELQGWLQSKYGT